MYNMIYRHCTAEGTPYEAGYELGMQLMCDKKLVKELTTPLFGGKSLPEKQAESIAALFEKYIPGINEEIKGFSDAVGVSYMDMVIYSSYIDLPGGCSHFAVLTKDGQQQQIYHGRNYDYNFDEPPILITVRRDEKSSTGFGCKIFGRFDGINEKGLCVTTSSVDMNHKGIIGNGFVFPMVVRALLDQCATAYDAREMLMEMPYAEYRNFLISDHTGSAILVEASPKKKVSKSIAGKDNNSGFLCSANHFNFVEADGIIPVKHSLIRQQKMEERLNRDTAKISINDVKALLSKRYPEGLAFPYYQGGMGTLWSIIYEPSSLSQYVCYGSPESGTWNLINQNAPTGCTETLVSLFDVDAPGDFWS